MATPNQTEKRIEHALTFECANGCEDGHITVTVINTTTNGRREWLCTNFQTCDCTLRPDQISGLEDEVIDDAREMLVAAAQPEQEQRRAA